MLKKIIYISTLVFCEIVSAQVFQDNKSVTCAPAAGIIRSLGASDYKEKLIWWGIEPGVPLSRYSLFVNDKTKSWTLLQLNETVACVLGTGESSNLLTFL